MRLTPWLVGIALAVCLARGDEPADWFSHKRHAALKLECAWCHSGAAKQARAGFPAVSRCLLCHKTMTHTSPVIERLKTLPADAVPFTARFHKLPDFVFFSHARHFPKVDCAACHGAVWEQDRPKPRVPLTMKGCVDCHKAKQAKLACDLCHELGQ